MDKLFKFKSSNALGDGNTQKDQASIATFGRVVTWSQLVLRARADDVRRASRTAAGWFRCSRFQKQKVGSKEHTESIDQSAVLEKRKLQVNDAPEQDSGSETSSSTTFYEQSATEATKHVVCHVENDCEFADLLSHSKSQEPNLCGSKAPRYICAMATSRSLPGSGEKQGLCDESSDDFITPVTPEMRTSKVFQKAAEGVPRITNRITSMADHSPKPFVRLMDREMRYISGSIAIATDSMSAGSMIRKGMADRLVPEHERTHPPFNPHYVALGKGSVRPVYGACLRVIIGKNSYDIEFDVLNDEDMPELTVLLSNKASVCTGLLQPVR